MPTDTKPYEVEPTKRKQEVVEELTDKLTRSTGSFMLDYRGLSVSELTDLRRKLDDTNVELLVVKNTLLRIAADRAEKDFGDMLSGPSAIAILFGDPVAPAKVFSDYLKDHREVALKGGVLKGRYMTPAQIEAVSKIPPKEVLLAQMLAGFQSPISGLVGTFNGMLSSFVFTLQAVADQKGGGGDAAEAAG